MTLYAVTWHPQTDNLGDDLLTLAASRLLPRVDRVLDADHLDAPQSDLEPDDRMVTLLCGSMMRYPLHWPPERHIAPAMVGVHISQEDVWGVPFKEPGETGHKYLSAAGTIGCRDERTMALLEDMGLPCILTPCLALALPRIGKAEQQEPYMVLCDVPEDVQLALRGQMRGMEVKTVTHTMKDPDPDYERRMRAAHDRLKLYAGAQCVVTRRLHCAMACLAMGTPVLLLYHAAYEDVTRFAPMDGMVQVETVEHFLNRVKAGRFLPRWSNPEGAQQWRQTLTQAVGEALERAENTPLPILSPEETTNWRELRLQRMAASAARKIHRLETERLENLHEKFSLVVREDSAKSTLLRLLGEKEVQKGLRRAALRRCLSMEKWYKRPILYWRIRQGKVETEDLYLLGMEALMQLGWPNKQE